MFWLPNEADCQKEVLEVFRQLMRMAMLGGVIVAFGGCGGGSLDLYPAKGKVTYKGAPVAEANVTFMHTNGQLSVASTDAQGEFSLTTAGQPGAPLGDYTVGIRKIKDVAGMPTNPKPEDMMKMMQGAGKTMPKPENELPAKYAAPQTSELKATVTEDEAKNNFPFELKD
jgi:hypothetical protein